MCFLNSFKFVFKTEDFIYLMLILIGKYKIYATVIYF